MQNILRDQKLLLLSEMLTSTSMWMVALLLSKSFKAVRENPLSGVTRSLSDPIRKIRFLLTVHWQFWPPSAFLYVWKHPISNHILIHWTSSFYVFSALQIIDSGRYVLNLKYFKNLIKIYGQNAQNYSNNDFFPIKITKLSCSPPACSKMF